MFKWLKSLFHWTEDLVEETRVIEVSDSETELDQPRIELTSSQYDDMIAHRLQELIDANKLPDYKYVRKFIESNYKVGTEYGYQTGQYYCRSYSESLKKIAKRWVINNYYRKCRDAYINVMMLTISESKIKD